MARILGVGIATLDVINEVDGYPPEDAEVRALGQRLALGGNAANTLTVLSLLGHDCTLAAALAAEPDGERIRIELERYRIGTASCRFHAGAKAPTSYVCLNTRNGSRTIVHYRDLPEYGYDDFRRVELDGFRWVHFEGRNVEETRRMLARARAVRPRAALSVEIEKPREGIEMLFDGAGVLLFSRVFAQARGLDEPQAFLRAMAALAPETDLVCAWGEAGGFALGKDGTPHHSPAAAPERIVDTLGAGDAFNAGIVDALVRGLDLPTALARATELAGAKCAMAGFDGLAQLGVPTP